MRNNMLVFIKKKSINIFRENKMAGHSKWSNTKHRKAAQDYKKNQKSMKLIRNITSASKKYGNNPNINFCLRAAIIKATNNNISKNSIKKAIQRGSLNFEKKKKIQQIKYAGCNKEGIIILISYISKNILDIQSKIHKIFKKYNFFFIHYLKIKYLFQECIIFLFQKTKKNEEILINLAIENNAYDIDTNSFKKIKIIINTFDAKNIKKEFKKFSLKILKTDTKVIAFKKHQIISLTIEKFKKFLKELKKIPEIQNISHNAFTKI